MLVVPGREHLPVTGARAGDPDAWDTLFRRYQLPLYTYVIELLHDEQSSLDVVQETFISAVRHIGGLRSDAKFGSWLFGIAHQKVVQRWRKSGRELPLEEDQLAAVPDDAADPGEWLVRQEDEEEFMKLLDELCLPQREALLLHFVEDFSLEEIAGVTGVAIGTVKSRLHYGKKALRKLMEERIP